MRGADQLTAAGGAVRGIVAAMAMTGMRRMTAGLGLVEETPPEEMATEGLPRLFARVPTEHRDEAVELAHWAFGAAAGAAFGALLPEALRHSRWAGPAYGLAIWALFERGMAPIFGLKPARERPVAQRLSIAADHLLYGALVAPRSRF